MLRDDSEIIRYRIRSGMSVEIDGDTNEKSKKSSVYNYREKTEGQRKFTKFLLCT